MRVQAVTQVRPFVPLASSTHPREQDRGSYLAPCPAAARELRGRAMKSARTLRRPRARIWAVVVALGLWAAASGAASAEPSAECRGLAARFAESADGLDLSALAWLMTCVSNEMSGRTGGAAPVPPPPPPAVAPPPQPSPPPQPPPPPPPPSSFREEWPQSAPWGNPWPNIGPDVR